MSITPSTLDAMVTGEQEVIAGLLEMDPEYRGYVKRIKARGQAPISCVAYHAAMAELRDTYAYTNSHLRRTRPEDYETNCRIILGLEHELCLDY